MDRELAGAVIDRWSNGLPVAEVSLYKAAAVMGIDPMAALVEARFYTYFDQCMSEKRAMSAGERVVFSAAAGLALDSMDKTASAYGFSPDELIFEALKERNFVPDLDKIAMLPPPPGMDPAAGGAGMAPGMEDPMAAVQEQAGEAMMAPPQEGAMVQQQPQQRTFKPSPTGPEQMMASPGGNMEELLQAQQGAFQDPGMQANGGQPPASGMPEPAPPPPSPEERIQQVGPNLDPETVGRYSEQLTRFEEGIQMQISDPKQMVKFVKELQKVDGKRIDQGIKAMGQQLEQEQAQELGVDGTPTIDGPGGAGGAGGPGQSVMSPKPGAPQGNEEPTPQEAQAGPQSPIEGDDPAMAQQAPKQPPPRKPAPPQQADQQAAQQAAVEKVANAARRLARASVR